MLLMGWEISYLHLLLLMQHSPGIGKFIIVLAHIQRDKFPFRWFCSPDTFQDLSEWQVLIWTSGALESVRPCSSFSFSCFSSTWEPHCSECGVSLYELRQSDLALAGLAHCLLWSSRWNQWFRMQGSHFYSGNGLNPMCNPVTLCLLLHAGPNLPFGDFKF